MPSIIIPHRWTQQPKYPVGYSRDNKLVANPLLVVNSGYGGKLLHDEITGQISGITNEPNIATSVGSQGIARSYTTTTTAAHTFPGRTTAVLPRIVMASLFLRTGPGNFPFLSATSSGNNGWRIGQGTGTSAYALTAGGVAVVGTNVTVLQDTLYFMICSMDQDNDEYAYHIRNMTTLSYEEQSGTSTTNSTAGDGTFMIGNARAANTFSFPGLIYLSVIAADFMPLVKMRQWSENPWQIFRPMQRRLYFGVAAAGGGGFKAAWARNVNTVLVGGRLAA